MSMSTVSVEFENPNFMPHVVWKLLKDYRNVQFDLGRILNISDANHTTDENDLAASSGSSSTEPPKLKKGRKPINEKVAPKRTHGAFRAFGRALEVEMMIKLVRPFKGEIDRKYRIKIFKNNMQVPGCCTEDHSDVQRITDFILMLLKLAYARIPPAPASLEAVQQRLSLHGEARLGYVQGSDFDKIKRGKVKIYSRNYTFHYNPLVAQKAPNGIEQDRVLHNPIVYDFMLNNPDTINTWVEECGLVNVTAEYTHISETANRRIQLLFYTPQLEGVGANTTTRKAHVTKAFMEASGKVNIELTNSYYWYDTLWRILSFMNKLFRPGFIRPRMSTNFSKKNAAYIDKFYEREIRIEDVATFVAGIDSEEQSLGEE